MKIAILLTNLQLKSATNLLASSKKKYLEDQGHRVEYLVPGANAEEEFYSQRFSLMNRVKRRALNRKTLPHLWDFLADRFEPQIHRGKYDAVIAEGQTLAYVLTRPLDCLKIVDVSNILFLESYYVWGPNLDEVEETYEKEQQIFEAADYLIMPLEELRRYFLEVFDKDGKLAAKTITARLGADKATRHAVYQSPPRIVYAGSYYYIQDPYLLATLTKKSPYEIDCYGGSDPNRKFLPAQLKYQGYAEDVGFLADYQFGLITLSRDLLRQHSPSTKFAYYFAHGLPVLFPEWMKEGYSYPNCAIPYNEENFVEQVQAAAEPMIWQRLSEAALDIAHDLTWEKVLKPVGDMLCKVNRAAEGENGIRT